MKTIKITREMVFQIFTQLFTEGNKFVFNDKHIETTKGLKKDDTLLTGLKDIKYDPKYDQYDFNFNDGRDDFHEIVDVDQKTIRLDRWFIIYWHWGMMYHVSNDGGSVMIYDDPNEADKIIEGLLETELNEVNYAMKVPVPSDWREV